MRRFVLIIGLLAAAAGLAAADEVFRFSYEEGEQYRVLSTVEQDVWLNDVFSHHATIFNRIAIAVTEVEEGRGFHDATFVTSEESVNGEQAFRWGEEYHSRFWRGERGHYEIDPVYFMPVVRDVPLFPKTAVAPGDTWTG